MTLNAQLRALPSVEELLVALTHLEKRFTRKLIANEVRRVLSDARVQIRNGAVLSVSEIETEVERSLAALEPPSLRPVINATGVILHTNLGRAPLSQFLPIPGYSNLEYDLAKGARGKRDTHVADLFERVIGAPAIAVNNNAAAVYLVLNEIAAGFEVIVSRGELIEIGDGFRIPDIMQRSGVLLREVGTTNRTRIEDYREAINERTRLLLRVHPSNFRIEGFTAKPSLTELVALGRERNIPVYEDLGSGCLMDLTAFGVHEPLVSESLRAGASIVSFSGDKLLGGPQAGIIAGDQSLVGRIRRNPMFRALRVDKLIYQALESTLRNVLLERWQAIPALAMIMQTAHEIRQRAEHFVDALAVTGVAIVEGESVIGGGSTPEQPLPTWLIVLTHADAVGAERALRSDNPPVIARIADDRVVLDLRTVFQDEEEALRRAVQALS